MAESQSHDDPEVAAKTLITEHADFLREAVATVAAQIMEAEITGQIGAGREERSAERSTHRNGYRERPPEDPFPYLWLDAKQLKVRDRGHVYSKALVIAYGVHKSGRREVIGLDIGEVESGAFWVEFLRDLCARGLHGVPLCVSDAHEGLKAAIARVLWVGPWQRCTVHFVRDMHQHCRPAQRSMVSAALREVFAAEGYEQAEERATV